MSQRHRPRGNELFASLPVPPVWCGCVQYWDDWGCNPRAVPDGGSPADRFRPCGVSPAPRTPHIGCGAPGCCLAHGSGCSQNSTSMTEIRIDLNIWVRSRNCGCLVTWFCYQLIAKPGNKTAAVSWPDPYLFFHNWASVIQLSFRSCGKMWEIRIEPDWHKKKWKIVSIKDTAIKMCMNSMTFIFIEMSWYYFCLTCFRHHTPIKSLTLLGLCM